jgi:hypothetical protein
MTREREASGVLVMRAWADGATPATIRARIILLSGRDREQTTMAAATVDQAVMIVRAWLETLTGGSAAGDR